MRQRTELKFMEVERGSRRRQTVKHCQTGPIYSHNRLTPFYYVCFDSDLDPLLSLFNPKRVLLPGKVNKSTEPLASVIFALINTFNYEAPEKGRRAGSCALCQAYSYSHDHPHLHGA